MRDICRQVCRENEVDILRGAPAKLFQLVLQRMVLPSPVSRGDFKRARPPRQQTAGGLPPEQIYLNGLGISISSLSGHSRTNSGMRPSGYHNFGSISLSRIVSLITS